MNLVEVHDGKKIDKIEVPEQVYWVIASPTPLAGMKYPGPSFPWQSLKEAGFSQVVSLHGEPYDPTPLTMAFAERLEDLVNGNPPANEVKEEQRIKRAVAATLAALQSGKGVVVHCAGGRGRSGTVLGCVLRDLGFEAKEIIEFLNRVHHARGRPGWPESPWQSALVRRW